MKRKRYYDKKGDDGIQKKLAENLALVAEAEISEYDIPKLEARLKKYASLVSDCDNIIKDCTENLLTAAKMEDIEESKKLKARINDASANREIFEIKVRVISARIRTIKHEKALTICGGIPKLPAGMDPLTFSLIIDHIYDRTEKTLIGDPKSKEGKTMSAQIAAIKKLNPELKKYTIASEKVENKNRQ